MSSAPHKTTQIRNIGNSMVKLMADHQMIPIIIGLAALWLFFGTQSPVFFSPRNISNLIVQSVVLSVLAMGVTFVLLVGEIDLSIASMSGITAVVMAKFLIEFNQSALVAVLTAIGVGMLIGFINGYITLRLLVPSFIVTLGVALMLGGIQLRILPDVGRISLTGTTIPDIASVTISGSTAWGLFILIGIGVFLLRYTMYREIESEKGMWTTGKVLILPVVGYLVIGGIGTYTLESHRGIPLPIIIVITLFAAASYVLNQTKIGVHIYAVGGNIEAAKRAGINVFRLKLLLFAIAGGLAAVGGIIAASRALAVSQASGGGIGGGALLLQAIAAPVIGGVSLFGGRGHISGAIIGALIIGTVSNGLNLMGIGNELRLIVTGGLLIVAVVIDKSIERISKP